MHMEHPLINDVDGLTIEQLQSKVTDLTKKYAWASRNNAHLAQQVAMALETYQNKLRQKQQEIYDAARKSSTDYCDRIDIS
jgi:hypothetical protein